MRTGSRTAILIDPNVREVGIDLEALVMALGGLGLGRTAIVPGLARHPELITGALKASGAPRARTAVVVSAEAAHPQMAKLRTWAEAGGLTPLGVRVVALDILGAQRSPAEGSAYAVRMVRDAVAALDAPGAAPAVRRPLGTALSRRALLSGRATTWVPVAEVDTNACLGMLRCGRCVQECPQDALQILKGFSGAPPVVDVSRCVACSQCLDRCPADALRLDGHDPRTLAKRLQALLQGGDGGPAPALVIACETAVEPLHQIGERGGLPGWLVLELSCLGGVGSAWLLAALAAGARSVQVLPCARCLDRGSVTQAVAITRGLLATLGDADAARRVGILPLLEAQLQRAVLAANGLTALVDGTGADRMPEPGAIETSAGVSPRVAAWAVAELRQALGTPVLDRHREPRTIRGKGAPLGALRAAERGCTACGVCARTCPTRALRLSTSLSTQLVLDPAACTGCGLCVESCPEDVLEVVPGVDLALLATGSFPIARVVVAACPHCGESVPALPAATHLTSLPAWLTALCPACRQAALVRSAQGN